MFHKARLHNPPIVYFSTWYMNIWLMTFRHLGFPSMDFLFIFISHGFSKIHPVKKPWVSPGLRASHQHGPGPPRPHWPHSAPLLGVHRPVRSGICGGGGEDLRMWDDVTKNKLGYWWIYRWILCLYILCVDNWLYLWLSVIRQFFV